MIMAISGSAVNRNKSSNHWYQSNWRIHSSSSPPDRINDQNCEKRKRKKCGCNVQINQFRSMNIVNENRSPPSAPSPSSLSSWLPVQTTTLGSTNKTMHISSILLLPLPVLWLLLLLLLTSVIQSAQTANIMGNVLSSSATSFSSSSSSTHHTPISNTGGIGEKHGPEFLVEPPSSVIFLNDTGSIITCSAKGIPTPTITWTRADGTPLTAISGLRQLRKDLLTTQLVYLPFSASSYRQDVHSGIIRCVASNSVGAIQSQDVHIRASVRQPYEIQVYDDFAIKGNTGILRCHIPSFVREYVHVTNWIRYDDEETAITSDLLKGGRYSVMPNGELHVHRIQDDEENDPNSDPDDSQDQYSDTVQKQHHLLTVMDHHRSSSNPSSASPSAATINKHHNNKINHGNEKKKRFMYQCQTKHLLSGTTKLSANYGRLIVTEPQSKMPPKIIATNARQMVVATVGQTIELPCVAQAYPWPTFTWYRIPGTTLNYQTTKQSLIKNNENNSNVKRLQRLLVSIFGINVKKYAKTHSKLENENESNLESTNIDNEHTITSYRLARAGKLVQVDSSLFIRDVTTADAGYYVCIANNSMGQDRTEIELLVKAPLSVTMIPNHLLASDGDTVMFNCSIQGSPIQRIQWHRNARPLSASPSLAMNSGNRVYLLDQDRILQIKQVRREDRGMFQCLVSNEFDSVQASGELALIDDPPSFISVFTIPEPLKPGKSLSIKCSATGTPLPQIVWTLDGVALADHGRIRVGDYVSSDGVVNSFVNITSLRTEDGGIYSCTASNDVHSISHSGRINVYGPAFVRQMKNITAISGNNIHLHCPAAGYPLESIIWYKKTLNGANLQTSQSNRLPQNHRHKSLLNGTLVVEKVERSSDEGLYRCVVTGTNRASTASAELFIRVLVAPVISPFNPPPNLREGMRVMLTCSVVEGDSPVLIQFLKDGDPIHDSSSPISTSRRIKLDVTNEFSATLFISSVMAEDSGNYTCIASNIAAVTTYSIVMKVNVPPKWKLPPIDTEAIEGQNVVIDCSASGEPRIWWERAYDKPSSLLSVSSLSSPSGSGTVSVANQQQQSSILHYFRTVVSNSHMHTLENGSLMIRDISEEDTGVYLCQANNGVGSGLSKVINVKVHVPAHFKSKFSAQTVQRGESIEFTCDAFGEFPLSIIVHKDRMPLDFGPERLEEQILHTDNRYRLIRKAGLTDGITTYIIRVINVDRRDSSLFTCLASNQYGKDEYNFQLIVQEPPGKPENVHILEIESRSAVIAWSQPYSGNSPVLAYHVEYRQWIDSLPPWHHIDVSAEQTNLSSLPNSKNDNMSMKHADINHQSGPPGTIFRQTLPGTESSISLRSLKPMTTYEIRVQAQNKLGWGAFQMPPLKITTKEEAPSGPPLNIHVYPISAHAIQVTFQPPKPEHQNGQVLGYYVGYKAVDLDEHFMFKKVIEEKSPSLITSPKDVKITDLRRATKYLIIVQAFNRIGPGPQSEEIIGETLVNDPPRAPILTSVNVDYDSVELTWSIETMDDSYDQSKSSTDIPEITGYFLYAKSPQSSEWEERQVDSQQTSFTFTNLLCGSQYQFYVIAYNNVGKGDPSQAIAIRTKGSVPIAPKNWNAFITVNSTVALIRLDAWLINGCEIKYFIIKYRLRVESEWLVASTQISPRDQRFVELVDLKPATWYLLNMAAITDMGTTEETYMFATLTIDGEKLPPLDTISRTLTSANSITTSGNMVGGTSDGISGYNSNSLNSMQSLTIVIPATCSVIVLTVIIIVACFVLGTKRSQQFESTLLTALNGAGNGVGGSAANHQSTPHHHHSDQLSSYCPTDLNEPRYSGPNNVVDHYGFFTGSGEIPSKCSAVAAAAAANNIEMINAANAVMNYATLKKRNTNNSNSILPSGINQPQSETDSRNVQMNQLTNTTTCLDSKLCDNLITSANLKSIPLMDPHSGMMMTIGDTAITTSITSSESNVHYFQTPYALSRLPRCTTINNQNNNNNNPNLGSEDESFSGCLNGCVTNNGISTTTATAGATVNGSTCTLRPVNRPCANANGDHVYDMPFPPKWV